MQINIDKITGKVVSFPSSFTYGVYVDDNFQLFKTIEIQSGEKQKNNKEGQLLYKINVQEDGTFEETINDKTITKTEQEEIINKWIDENGIEQSNVVTIDKPIEWVDNEPIMIPNIIPKIINFLDNPLEFTVEEILKAKYQTLLDNSSYDYILADMFINEEDIDLEDKNHSANTGIALMQLLPNGQAKTKTIELETSANTFTLLELEGDVDVYINDNKIINKKVVLSNPTDKAVVKFVNTTNKYKEIKSYAIAY